MIELAGLLAFLAMAGITWRWGHGGVVRGYVGGAALCLAVWYGAVLLVGRLDGDRPADLAASLLGAAPSLAGLLVAWLLIASAGVVVGAGARALQRRASRGNPRVR